MGPSKFCISGASLKHAVGYRSLAQPCEEAQQALHAFLMKKPGESSRFSNLGAVTQTAGAPWRRPLDEFDARTGVARDRWVQEGQPADRRRRNGDPVGFAENAATNEFRRLRGRDGRASYRHDSHDSF